MRLQVEAQRGEPMLAVDDEELGLRLGQVTDAFANRCILETQLLVREQQHAARDRRLRYRRFIEVFQLAHLGA